ncbi:hypothetical protein D3C73_911010 [compost metagenome]
MGADPDGEGLQRAPFMLAQRRQVALDLAPGDQPARLDQAKGQAARQARQGPALDGVAQPFQRFQRPSGLARQPGLQAPLGPFARRGRPQVAQQPHARRKGVFVDDAAGQGPAPQHPAVGRDGKGRVVVRRQPSQAPRHLRPHGPRRRLPQRPVGQGRAARVGGEAHPVQMADHLALDRHLAVLGHARQHVGAHVQRSHQGRRAPVDEARRQPLVQHVAEPLLQRLGLVAPALRLIHPVRPIGDVGQGPHPRQPRRQLVDLAVVAVQVVEARGDPVLGQPPAPAGQGGEDLLRQPRVLVQRRLLEVRQLARLPQTHQGPARAGDLLDVLIDRKTAQQGLVQRLGGQPQAMPLRRDGQ